jgi:glycosyltransferase involved in cell wall biosynthesis
MNNSNKKILIVHKYSGFIGGIERYIFDTVSLLRKNGYLVYALFEERISQNSDKFESVFDSVSFVEIDNLKSQIGDFSKKGIRSAFIHKITIPSLFKQLHEKFTTTLFVHDHDYYCMKAHKYYLFTRSNCHRPFNTVVCSICTQPLYRTETGRISLKSVKPLIKRKIFRLSRQCDSFIVLSEHMRNNLIINKYDKNKIIKIYPVIKDKGSVISKTKSGELLFVGQIIRGKGLDLLLQALTMVRGNFKLNIVGKGNDESYIKKLVKEYKLESKVNFVGFTLDIASWYNSASMVIVPSRWQEPFGLIGGEAFSYKKPVIGFDVGGILEWLKNEVNGFLIKKNDTNELASKIDYLLENPKIAEKMGVAGNEMLKTMFNEAEYLRNILKLMGDPNV